MSSAKHPNDKVNNYISQNLTSIKGIELTKCESKETIVFDEKEISWIYTFKKEGSSIDITLTVSDPIYFCEVFISKSKKDFFALKSYLKNILRSEEIENLLNNFYDEKLNEEEYTLKYLDIFKKYLASKELNEIMDGESWPRVPSEEENQDQDDDY